MRGKQEVLKKNPEAWLQGEEDGKWREGFSSFYSFLFFFFFKTVETLEDIAVVEEPVKKKSRKKPVSIRQREDPKNVGVNAMHSIGRG